MDLGTFEGDGEANEANTNLTERVGLLSVGDDHPAEGEPARKSDFSQGDENASAHPKSPDVQESDQAEQSTGPAEGEIVVASGDQGNMTSEQVKEAAEALSTAADSIVAPYSAASQDSNEYSVKWRSRNGYISLCPSFIVEANARDYGAQHTTDFV